MEEGRIPDNEHATRGPHSIKKDCAIPSSPLSSLTNKISIFEADKIQNAIQISKLQEIGATEDWEQYDLPCFEPEDVLRSLRVNSDLLMALDAMDWIRSGWLKACIVLDQKLELCLAVCRRGAAVKKSLLELEASGAEATLLKNELEVEKGMERAERELKDARDACSDLGDQHDAQVLVLWRKVAEPGGGGQSH
jgi:hypothetical protein